MPVPNIDTFEHDIAKEIQNKEATIGDIASAGGEIDNTKNNNSQKKPVIFITIVIILCLCGIVAGGIFGYSYYEKKQNPSQLKTLPNSPVIPNISLSDISPTLDENIGRYITNIQHSDYGYSMTVTSYTPVFAYMIKNENAFANEIAKALEETPDTTSTDTTDFIFTDITNNNQNMRVGTNGTSTIVYAFVNTETILISRTTEGILSMRSVILH
jgi:hypothetical protein